MRYIALILLLALGLAVAGCGGGDESPRLDEVIAEVEVGDDSRALHERLEDYLEPRGWPSACCAVNSTPPYLRWRLGQLASETQLTETQREQVRSRLEAQRTGFACRFFLRPQFERLQFRRPQLDRPSGGRWLVCSDRDGEVIHEPILNPRTLVEVMGEVEVGDDLHALGEQVEVEVGPVPVEAYSLREVRRYWLEDFDEFRLNERVTGCWWFGAGQLEDNPLLSNPPPRSPWGSGEWLVCHDDGEVVHEPIDVV